MSLLRTVRLRIKWSIPIVLLVFLSCSSVDVVRLQPDLMEVPEGMEPIAGIQATCLGFYLFTLGIPEADLEKAVNEMLFEEARKLGADRIMNLRFDATPSSGIWWLSKLLGFRSASAWGVAIKKEDSGLKEELPTTQKVLTPLEKNVSMPVEPNTDNETSDKEAKKPSSQPSSKPHKK